MIVTPNIEQEDQCGFNPFSKDLFSQEECVFKKCCKKFKKKGKHCKKCPKI